MSVQVSADVSGVTCVVRKWEQGVAVSGVWGSMGLNGDCLRKSKTADVFLLV
ncbi:unnamed protein product [Ectocarpus sp. CCAP 1310/34]|nr:unnamed protein product [Ectocarpus sp. CCAP 1310/34]